MPPPSAQSETKSELLQDWTQYMLLAIKFLKDLYMNTRKSPRRQAHMPSPLCLIPGGLVLAR